MNALSKAVTEFAENSRIPCSVLLVIASLLIYGQTVYFPLIWDSVGFIKDNPYILSIDIKLFFTTATTIYADQSRVEGLDQLQYYRPVLQTLFSAWHQVAGDSAALWHGLAVAVNCAVVIVVFRVMEAAGQSRLAAFAIALLYAVNPGRVEAVAWVYGLSNQFFSLFILLALWAWVTNNRWLSLAFWLLSLGTRETAILFPAIALAWAWLMDRKNLSPKWLGLQVVTVLLYLWVRALVTGAMPPVGGLDPFTLLNTAVVILKRVFVSMLWPSWGVWLQPFKDFSSVTKEVWVSYLFVASLLFMLLLALRRSAWFAFWLSWFFIWTVLVFNAGQFGTFLTAEKGTHLLAVGVAVLLFEIIRWLAVRIPAFWTKNFLVFGTLALTVAHGGLAVWRASHWQNHEIYFTSAIEREPDFGVLHFSLGQYYLKEQRWPHAEASFEETVRIWPNFPLAWNNLGNLRYLRNDWDGAEEAWSQAYRADPQNATAVYNLAIVAEKNGDHRSATLYRQKYMQLTRSQPGIPDHEQ